MPRTYTKREIAYTLSASPNTIRDDIKFLNISPQTAPGKPNLYSEHDYQLICQLRSHVSQGNDRDSFIPTAIAVIDDGGIVSKHDDDRNVEIAPKAIDIAIASYYNNLHQDPFYNLELLERVVKNGWSLPTKLIALLIDNKSKDFTKYDSFNYCGFRIFKVEELGNLGRGFHWMVTK